MRRTRGQGESGAALVEFALIFPVFMMLVLGMFSGGLAYNHKLSLAGAAREASRYGATLASDPASSCGNAGSDAWLTCVANNAVSSATGDLAPDDGGRDICVAYYSGAAWFSLHIVGAGSPTFTPDGECFADGLGSDKRVQVDLQRDGEINLLFQTMNLELKGRSTTRSES